MIRLLLASLAVTSNIYDKKCCDPQRRQEWAKATRLLSETCGVCILDGNDIPSTTEALRDASKAACDYVKEAQMRDLSQFNLNSYIVDSMGRTGAHYLAFAERTSDVEACLSAMTFVNPEFLNMPDGDSKLPIDIAKEGDKENDQVRQFFDLMEQRKKLSVAISSHDEHKVKRLLKENPELKEIPWPQKMRKSTKIVIKKFPEIVENLIAKEKDKTQKAKLQKILTLLQPLAEKMDSSSMISLSSIMNCLMAIGIVVLGKRCYDLQKSLEESEAKSNKMGEDFKQEKVRADGLTKDNKILKETVFEYRRESATLNDLRKIKGRVQKELDSLEKRKEEARIFIEKCKTQGVFESESNTLLVELTNKVSKSKEYINELEIRREKLNKERKEIDEVKKSFELEKKEIDRKNDQLKKERGNLDIFKSGLDRDRAGIVRANEDLEKRKAEIEKQKDGLQIKERTLLVEKASLDAEESMIYKKQEAILAGEAALIKVAEKFDDSVGSIAQLAQYLLDIKAQQEQAVAILLEEEIGVHNNVLQQEQTLAILKNEEKKVHHLAGELSKIKDKLSRKDKKYQEEITKLIGYVSELESQQRLSEELEKLNQTIISIENSNEFKNGVMISADIKKLEERIEGAQRKGSGLGIVDMDNRIAVQQYEMQQKLTELMDLNFSELSQQLEALKRQKEAKLSEYKASISRAGRIKEIKLHEKGVAAVPSLARTIYSLLQTLLTNSDDEIDLSELHGSLEEFDESLIRQARENHPTLPLEMFDKLSLLLELINKIERDESDDAEYDEASYQRYKQVVDGPENQEFKGWSPWQTSEERRALSPSQIMKITRGNTRFVPHIVWKNQVSRRGTLPSPVLLKGDEPPRPLSPSRQASSDLRELSKKMCESILN